MKPNRCIDSRRYGMDWPDLRAGVLGGGFCGVVASAPLMEYIHVVRTMGKR